MSIAQPRPEEEPNVDISLDYNDYQRTANRQVPLLESLDDPLFADSVRSLTLELGFTSRAHLDTLARIDESTAESDAYWSGKWTVPFYRDRPYKMDYNPNRRMTYPTTALKLLWGTPRLKSIALASGMFFNRDIRVGLREVLKIRKIQSLDLSFDVRDSIDTVLHHHIFPRQEDYTLLAKLETLILPLNGLKPERFLPPPQTQLKLKSLTLHHTNLVPNELKAFLSACPALEHLAVHAIHFVDNLRLSRDRVESYIDCSELDETISLVSASLKYLELTSHVCDKSHWDFGARASKGTLKKLATFERLATLKLPYMFLLDWEYAAGLSLAEVLPPQLQHITLTDDLQRGFSKPYYANPAAECREWTVSQIFDSLAALIKKRTSPDSWERLSLHTLQIHFQSWSGEGSHQKARNGLRTICEDRGVKFELELFKVHPYSERFWFQDRFTGRNYDPFSPRLRNAREQRIIHLSRLRPDAIPESCFPGGVCQADLDALIANKTGFLGWMKSVVEQNRAEYDGIFA